LRDSFVTAWLLGLPLDRQRAQRSDLCDEEEAKFGFAQGM
jgi:hypothetical protein